MIYIKRNFETLEVKVSLRGVPSITPGDFSFSMELVINTSELSEVYCRLKEHGTGFVEIRIPITPETQNDYNRLRELVYGAQHGSSMITCIRSELFSRNMVSLDYTEINVPHTYYFNSEVRSTFDELASHLQPTEFRNRTICQSNTETIRLFFKLQRLVHGMTRNQTLRILDGSILV